MNFQWKNCFWVISPLVACFEPAGFHLFGLLGANPLIIRGWCFLGCVDGPNSALPACPCQGQGGCLGSTGGIWFPCWWNTLDRSIGAHLMQVTQWLRAVQQPLSGRCSFGTEQLLFISSWGAGSAATRLLRSSDSGRQGEFKGRGELSSRNLQGENSSMAKPGPVQQAFISERQRFQAGLLVLWCSPLVLLLLTKATQLLFQQT